MLLCVNGLPFFDFFRSLDSALFPFFLRLFLCFLFCFQNRNPGVVLVRIGRIPALVFGFRIDAYGSRLPERSRVIGIVIDDDLGSLFAVVIDPFGVDRL